MISALLLNIMVVCTIAAIAAVILYFVSQKFMVEKSPVEEAIYNILPHANCGACGKAGCQAFAEACVKADANTFAQLFCPVGGNEIMSKIAALKGMNRTQNAKTCAVLRCQGTCQNAPEKITYTGSKSCRIANMVMAGRGGCPNGCLRFGDCVAVCQFGALSLNAETGMPQIDYKKCTSCGACVKRCPRGLFEIRPIIDEQQVYVACRNQQKGAVARKNCSAACIACGKCSKITPQVVINNNLSYIPTEVSPQEYGQKLADECPVKAIVYRINM